MSQRDTAANSMANAHFSANPGTLRSGDSIGILLRFQPAANSELPGKDVRKRHAYTPSIPRALAFITNRAAATHCAKNGGPCDPSRWRADPRVHSSIATATAVSPETDRLTRRVCPPLAARAAD